MKGTHGLAVRRAGWIGLIALLWALAAFAQAPEPTAPAVEPLPAAAIIPPAAFAVDEVPELAAPPEVTEEQAPRGMRSEGEAERRSNGQAPASFAQGAEGERSPSGQEPAVVSTPAQLPGPPVSLLEQAWLAPSADFDARVARTRRTALELGAWSLDPAARSLAAGDSGIGALARSAAAVELAPDLPAAHMRLAHALWLQGGSPMAAIRAVVAAFQAIGRHLEASLWFAGSGLYLLAIALVSGGLLAVTLTGLSGLLHAAHDLGHLFSRTMPDFARCAGLAALLMVPLALGEGALGLALGLLGIAVIYGRRAQRLAMLLAAAGIGLGAYPVMRYAGAALAAFPEDPVAEAAYAAAHGVSTPVEVERLSTLADSDALAARGLAIHARRSGDLGGADALYQRLIETGAGDVAALNNAANVRLDLGHMDRAIELYTRAASRQESPVVLFNLAQAYGRAFQVEDLNRTIAHAQRVGGELIAQLTALQGTDTAAFVVDMPLPPSMFWFRALRSHAGSDVAQEFRAPFAPGRLGRDPLAFAAAAAAVLVLGSGFGRRFDPSCWCKRCGDRVCPRCDPQGVAGALCDGCNKLFFAPEKTDRVLRARRVNELRAREERVDRAHTIVSLLVPGAAGLLAERPVSGWLGALCSALGVAAFVWHEGVVPDPLVAGATAPVAFFGVAAVAAVGYAFAVWTSLAARRQR